MRFAYIEFSDENNIVHAVRKKWNILSCRPVMWIFPVPVRFLLNKNGCETWCESRKIKRIFAGRSQIPFRCRNRSKKDKKNMFRKPMIISRLLKKIKNNWKLVGEMFAGLEKVRTFASAIENKAVVTQNWALWKILNKQTKL